MPIPKKQQILAPKPQWRANLSECITAIAWFPDGQLLAVATAAGEVVLYRDSQSVVQRLTVLQPATDTSIDCLGFSANGQWLAAAGQNGKVLIWNMGQSRLEPAIALDRGGDWIDRLVWHPTRSEFAFSLGKYIQVWSAEIGDILTTVNFDLSSVLALNWHPSGDWLTVGGYQGIKLWDANDWDADPVGFELPTATGVMAWELTGEYLAANTMDKMVVLLQWLGSEFDRLPWQMQGFPGKIRAFAWSKDAAPYPVLVTSSGLEIAIWRRHEDPDVGWEGEVLKGHQGNVNLLAFQPNSDLLASAGEDGIACLWQTAGPPSMAQALNDSKAEITCLQWHPQAKKLAVGNIHGEIILWAKSTQARGFA